ncbi:MAG: ImmA/IrrE family metallo-endopeptidase [Romboutsia timonensis]
MRFSKEIKQLIKSTKITNFPIGTSEIKQIIERSGWEIYSYKDGKVIIDSFNLQCMVDSNDAFATRIGDRFIIFYNDNISPLDFPFILAHEIGHIVLGHLDNTENIYEKERDSAYFANELLQYVPKFRLTYSEIIAGILILLSVWAICMAVKTKKDNTDNISTEIITSTISSTNTDSITTTESYLSETSSTISEIIETEAISQTVFITKFGTKYHLAGCRYIKDKDDLIELSVDEAEHAGYEPCDVCIGE